jgi:hypothetical protein
VPFTSFIQSSAAPWAATLRVCINGSPTAAVPSSRPRKLRRAFEFMGNSFATLEFTRGNAAPYLHPKPFKNNKSPNEWAVRQRGRVAAAGARRREKHRPAPVLAMMMVLLPPGLPLGQTAPPRRAWCEAITLRGGATQLPFRKGEAENQIAAAPTTVAAAGCHGDEFFAIHHVHGRR